MPIDRELHVESELARAELQRGAQRRQRVLRVLGDVAAAGDQLGKSARWHWFGSPGAFYPRAAGARCCVAAPRHLAARGGIC